MHWIIAVEPLFKLNKTIGKGRLNKEEYPSLDSKLKEVDKWWDSLTKDQKVEIGGMAVHYSKMSANYKWDCGPYLKYKRKHTPFNELSKSQQKIVKWCWDSRNNMFQAFYLPALIKL